MESERPLLTLLEINSQIGWTYIGSQLFLLFLLLIGSALVSGSEVAFFSLTSKDLESVEDSLTQQRMVKLLDKPKIMLGAILITNNLINVAIVTLSTYMSWQLAGSTTGDHVVLWLIPVVVTVSLVLFGEVIPKIYANQKSLRFALFMLLPMSALNFILRPFSFLLTTLTTVIERRWQNKGYQFSVDEINEALDVVASQNEETTKEEKEILRSIVNFSSKTVKQIMKSRMDITTLEIDTDFHQLMDRINKCRFSRIPIYNDTVDSIVGILYIKDLLPYLDQPEDFKWQKLLRKVYFIPEYKRIDDLLKNFQEKRVHMAIVVDEYGGTSGLVTLEDVIEEIVGEINDEFDGFEVDYRKVGKNIFVFEGKTSLNDLTKILDLKPDTFDGVKGDSESLGGLVLELNSSMPHVGDEVSFENFLFKIESVSAKRIKRIRVIVNEIEAQ